MASSYVDCERIRRGGLIEFQRRAWPLVESCEFVEEPHIRIVCRHLEGLSLRAFGALAREQPWAADLDPIKDLVVAIPPGFSKSVTAMVFFPAWVWTWAPHAKFITTSYSDGLALRDAKRSFELMTSEWFKERWPAMTIDGGERASMAYYVNSSQGSRFAVSIGGSVTGRHGHILLGDDPVKPQDIELGGESAAGALAKVRERWDGVFSSRSADPPNFATCVIAQRLHVNDLSGHLIARGATHLCLPMEFVPERRYASPWGSDWRTERDELMAPLRFPAEVRDDRKRKTTVRAWAAQYQQTPAPDSGALFQREWFTNRWAVLPPGARYLISVDSSLKAGKDSDYCVIQVWAQKGRANFYLVDQHRERMGFSSTVRAIRRMREKWPIVSTVLIEDKANGPAIVDTLKRSMTGVVAVNPEGGKTARANAIEPMLRAGDVFFPETSSFMDDLIEECAAFPVGASDDQVDALSQALLFMSGRTRNALFQKAMMNVARGRMMR